MIKDPARYRLLQHLERRPVLKFDDFVFNNPLSLWGFVENKMVLSLLIKPFQVLQ